MVRFHGLCDGKRMVRKTIVFAFCMKMSIFFGARYLMIKNY